MAIQVKICGITSVEAADAAARAGADFAGLVFHVRSPRNVTSDQAARLASGLRGRTRLVCLLSDPQDDDVDKALAATKADYIQLHGRETPERVGALRARFGKPVIKAIAIAEAADFACVPAYEAVADMLLFDARSPTAAEREGGHGSPFDWQLLCGRMFKRPWLLAGGLNADNVARAVRTAGAPGVDVSSGVEAFPGLKSAELITTFVANARAAQFVPEHNA
jgi:phosphoribosylanthranilate isomerase